MPLPLSNHLLPRTRGSADVPLSESRLSAEHPDRSVRQLGLPPAHRSSSWCGQLLGGGALDGAAEDGEFVRHRWSRDMGLERLGVVAHDVDAVGGPAS